MVHTANLCVRYQGISHSSMRRRRSWAKSLSDITRLREWCRQLLAEFNSWHQLRQRGTFNMRLCPEKRLKELCSELRNREQRFYPAIFKQYLPSSNETCKENRARVIREEDAESVMVLNQQDIDRFESSLSNLADYREQCVSRGYISDDAWHSRVSMKDFESSVVKKWPGSLRRAGFSAIPCSDQHGDLNPRNIMLSPSIVQLIDWARWGCWPMGYDLVRLELQLLLRLIILARWSMSSR